MAGRCASQKTDIRKVPAIAKEKAQAELDAILVPINSRASTPSDSTTWGEFVTNTHLPFYSWKWKFSTKMCNEDRFRVHLTPIYGNRALGSFQRDELQELLGSKAKNLSYRNVAHLR
jgi:hypothetical protein